MNMRMLKQTLDNLRKRIGGNESSISYLKGRNTSLTKGHADHEARIAALEEQGAKKGKGKKKGAED